MFIPFIMGALFVWFIVGLGYLIIWWPHRNDNKIQMSDYEWLSRHQWVATLIAGTMLFVLSLIAGTMLFVLSVIFAFIACRELIKSNDK